MICPACGCQQRESDTCIQCYIALSPEKEKEGDSITTFESPPLEPSQEDPLSKTLTPKQKEEESVRHVVRREQPIESETARESQSIPPRRGDVSSKTSPPKKEKQESVRRVEPRPQPVKEEKSHKILITTTQRIEGKRITTYFGLISADIIIELGERLHSQSDKNVKSMNIHYRSDLKKGMLTALRDLRGEAALLGANAVIATSFNYQKMDSQALLLSAVGTAVHMEDRT